MYLDVEAVAMVAETVQCMTTRAARCNAVGPMLKLQSATELKKRPILLVT